MAGGRASVRTAVGRFGPIEARPSRAIAAASTGAALLTMVSLTVEPLRSLPAAEHLQLGLETPGALVAAAGALVLTARFVQTRARADALLALGLGLVSATGLVFAVGPMIGGGAGRGPASVALLVGWLVAAATLAAGGCVDTGRLPSFRRTPAMLRTAAATALGGLIVLGWWLSPKSPRPSTARRARGPSTVRAPFARALALATAALFLLAAAGLARRADRDRDRPAAWLAVAAGLGACLSADHALFPWLQSDFAFRGDLVRVAFYVVLAVAAASGVADHRRRAARAAVLDERRRLARELHDGLAQELAYIATHAATLDDRPVADVAGARLAKAAERALEESRAAIAALTLPLRRLIALGAPTRRHAACRHARGDAHRGRPGPPRA